MYELIRFHPNKEGSVKIEKIRDEVGAVQIYTFIVRELDLVAVL